MRYRVIRADGTVETVSAAACEITADGVLQFGEYDADDVFTPGASSFAAGDWTRVAEGKAKPEGNHPEETPPPDTVAAA